jgi:hypothetical protein
MAEPLTEETVRHFAREWVDAWNAHDLERILSHYAEDVVLSSPVAARLVPESSGEIRGIDALRAYFARGLAAIPNLRFDLVEPLWGLSSIVLYYDNNRGNRTAEFMEFNHSGKVTRVVANYSA